MDILHYLYYLDASQNRVHLEGPYGSADECHAAALDPDQVPLELDPTPHRENMNGECLLMVLQINDELSDVVGPFRDSEERRIDKIGYLREGHAALTLDLRGGAVISASYHDPDALGEDPYEYAYEASRSHLEDMTDDEQPYEAPERAEIRTKPKTAPAGHDAAAFEIIDGTEGRYYFFGGKQQLEDVLQLAHRDAGRLRKGETVKQRHKVEMFLTSDLFLTQPEQATNEAGKRITGAYLGVIHSDEEPPTLTAEEEAAGAFDLGWSKFIYSNGRTVMFYGTGGPGKRIKTRSIPIEVLEVITASLKK